MNDPTEGDPQWDQIRRITAMRKELASLKRFNAALDKELAKEAPTPGAKEAK